MALPKKTSRRIVVGNRNYRWTVSDSLGTNPSWADESIALALTLIVETEGDVNSRIYDRIAFPKVAGERSLYLDCGYQEDSLVYPRHVAAIVSAAIAGKWQPDSGTDYESALLSNLLLDEMPPELASQLTLERLTLRSSEIEG